MKLKWEKVRNWGEEYECFDENGRLLGTVGCEMCERLWSAGCELRPVLTGTGLGDYKTKQQAMNAVEVEIKRITKGTRPC